MRLKDRVALITGAGRGIGSSISHLFARERARLILCSRTRSEIDEVASKIGLDGGRVYSEAMDISDPNQVSLLVQRGVDKFGPVEILINNASLLGPMVPLSEMPLSKWKEVISVNLTSLFYLTQKVLPGMVEKGHGCVVNMTSSLGRKGRALWGAYSISKFGVEGITQVLAEELHGKKIRVMALNPGGTRTQMRAKAYPHEDRSRLHDPEDIAQVVLHMVLNIGLEDTGHSFDAKDLLPIIGKD